MNGNKTTGALDELGALLSKLPGLGSKSAARIAFHLVNSPEGYNRILAEKIAKIQEVIHPCPVCGSYTEDEICAICSDPSRDSETLCIVEQPADVISIQRAGIYNGLFHVLGGAINPLAGIGPEDLSFSALSRRIAEGNFKEVIIATNPTEEGDTTALYIRRLLADYPGLSLTRLASGLPVGGDLEYADRTTLTHSLRGRVKF